METSEEVITAEIETKSDKFEAQVSTRLSGQLRSPCDYVLFRNVNITQ
ncbi:MAG: hypothetical protein ACI8PB_002820 [Desulforhopalus sp.]|jgi:hypothetical protein